MNETTTPTAFPSSYHWSYVETSFPTSQPTNFTRTATPSFAPTMRGNHSLIFVPTAPPHSYNLIEDVTDPKKFNFLALALSLFLLTIVVSVTIYGICQRYTVVRKRTLAQYKYRRSRASTPERFRMYFEQDVGSPDDVNSIVRGVYTAAPNVPDAEPRSYDRIPSPVHSTTHVIGVRSTPVNSP
jgi:hypothetical protein